MGKYDQPLNMSWENEPHTKILKSVTPGSVVLEFGCAGGVMTEYLSNTLGCRVYIVEIVKEYFDDAVKFAEDGFCGDASSLEWFDKFKEQKFDFILFADVLEHLYDPRKVLQKSAELLKDDGRVLMSIPNIAHNSIIFSLLNNKFEYRQNGLLDFTHIRFFTYYSLLEMLDQTGLAAVVEDAVYLSAGQNEFKEEYNSFAGNLEALRHREYGNVYQFIVEAVKKSFYLENKDSVILQNKIDTIGYPLFSSPSIYLDSGNGFNENENMRPPISLNGDFSCEFFLDKDVTRLRFDPVEELSCVVSGLNILSDAGRLGYKVANGFTVENYHIFPTRDPQILIEPAPGVTWVSIECKINPYDASALTGIFASLKERLEGAEQEKNELHEAFTKKVSELKTEILNETKALEEQTLAMEALLREAERHHRIIEENNEEKAALKRSLDEKTVEAEAIGRVCDEKNAEINELGNVLAQTEAGLAQTKVRLAEAEAKYRDISTATLWKITKPLRAALGLLKKKNA